MATTYAIAPSRAGVGTSVVRESTTKTCVTPVVVLTESAAPPATAGPRVSLIV